MILLMGDRLRNVFSTDLSPVAATVKNYDFGIPFPKQSL